MDGKRSNAGDFEYKSDEINIANNWSSTENELEFETLNLVGGMSDAKDIVNGKYSSEMCLIREFKEELDLDLEEENWNIQLKYLKYSSKNENPVGYPVGTIYEIYNYEHKKQYMPELFEKIFSSV